jgi:hypothetical protein
MTDRTLLFLFLLLTVALPVGAAAGFLLASPHY